MKLDGIWQGLKWNFRRVGPSLSVLYNMYIDITKFDDANVPKGFRGGFPEANVSATATSITYPSGGWVRHRTLANYFDHFDRIGNSARTSQIPPLDSAPIDTLALRNQSIQWSFRRVFLDDDVHNSDAEYPDFFNFRDLSQLWIRPGKPGTCDTHTHTKLFKKEKIKQYIHFHHRIGLSNMYSYVYVFII